MKKILIGILALLAALAVTSPVGAAGRYNASIELAPNSVVVFGGTIDFVWLSDYTSDQGFGPWLQLNCYEQPTKGNKLGPQIYFENRAGFEGGYRYGEPFTLGPSLAWTGQPATCVGSVGHIDPKRGYIEDATVTFDVDDYVIVPDAIYSGYTTALAADGPEDRYVFVQCYNPEYVYAAYFEVVDGIAEIGPLWSTLWPESSAECTATLGYAEYNQGGNTQRWIELASTTFMVNL